METRRERKKRQTRQALLDAAMTLFAERGIYGTRVEDITERVDLGKGAFYNYFPSKDAVIAELVARGVERFDSGYLSKLNGSRSLAERVGEIARLHDAFLDGHPQYALLLHQARGLLQLKESNVEKLGGVFSAYLLRVGRALTPASDGESWPDDELRDLAAAVMGSVAGYRSFRIAANLPAHTNTATQILTLGLPELMQRRRAEYRAAPPE